MSSNLTRAVTVLGTVKLNDDEILIQESMIPVLMNSDAVGTSLLKWIFEKMDLSTTSERYWASVVEALITIRYDVAHQLLAPVRTALRIQLSAHRFYPATIIGLLAATNWCYVNIECLIDPKTEKKNEEYAASVSKTIGGMLCDFAEQYVIKQPGKETVPSSWAVGRFSEEICTFLAANFANDSERRTIDLLEVLRSTPHPPRSAEKLLSEVAERIGCRMTFAKYFEIFYLDAVKSDPRNK